MPPNQPRATDATPAMQWRREAGLAALVALWVVLWVLWTPLTKLRTHTFGPWDWLSESSTVTALPPPTGVQTNAMEDPVRQMIPWAWFAREEFARGEAPLWNPRNGAGVPVVANFQSAVYSPFVAPFYVFPLWLATLLSAALKLATGAGSMYLFLRALGRSRWASAFGGAGYALYCFHRTYLLHPHVGVLALFPLGLLIVELGLQAFERDRERLPWRHLASLGLLLGALVLAGHPESLLFTVYGIALYALFRWGGLWLSARRTTANPQREVRLGFGLLVFGLAGAALGALQIAPFAEYLVHSAASALGGRDVERLAPLYLLLQFFPNVVGTPKEEPWIPHALSPHYHEVNSFHVGALYALFALAALLFLGRERRGWFFAALGGGVLLYVFDAPLIGTLLQPFFGADFVPAPRAGALWAACACALAALAADHLMPARGAVPRARALAFLVVAVGLVFLARWGCEPLWRSLAERSPAEFELLAPKLHEHVRDTTALILIGLSGLGLHVVVRRGWSRVAAYAALFVSSAIAGELAFHDYVPASEDRYVLPQTPAMETLREEVGDRRLVMLSPLGLRSNANLFYDLDLVMSYDALEIRELDELRSAIFGYSGYQAVSPYASRRGMDLFGIEYIATRADWLPLDTDRCRRGAPDSDRMWTLAIELGLGVGRKLIDLATPDARYTQRFTATRDELDGVVVHFMNEKFSLTARVRVALLDGATEQRLASRTAKIDDLRLLAGQRREFVLRFDGIKNSREREFVLEVTIERKRDDAVVQMHRARVVRANANGALEVADEAESDVDAVEEGAQDAADGGRGAAGKKRARAAREGVRSNLGPRALLDVSYGLGDFEVVGECADFTLRRYASSLGRAWIVLASEVEPDESRAFGRVLDNAFDPRRTVLLNAGEPRSAPPDASFELEELAHEPRRNAWRYRSDAPAYLVVAQAFYPGWSATVDGRPAKVLRANYAFDAIELPAGGGEVEMLYDPASFRWGLRLSMLTLVALLGVLIAARPRAS